MMVGQVVVLWVYEVADRKACATVESMVVTVIAKVAYLDD